MAHESRKHFPFAHPFLVTLKVRESVASLRNGAVIREIEKTFRQGAERGEFRLVHYSVRAPRTWLLAVGWRRLGLLDPAEVPG